MLFFGLQGYGVILISLLMFVITAPFVHSKVGNITNIYIVGIGILAIVSVYFLAGKSPTISSSDFNYQSQIITDHDQKSVNKKVDEGVISDVISALENLGYQRVNAYAASLAAAERLGDSVSLQVLIREALSELSTGKSE